MYYLSFLDVCLSLLFVIIILPSRFITTISTAQNGGGSFKNRKREERLVVVSHGWQSKHTDGPTGV